MSARTTAFHFPLKLGGYNQYLTACTDFLLYFPWDQREIGVFCSFQTKIVSR